MKKIRIGNDIHFKWMITREGVVENFDGKQVDVELRDQTGRRWPVKWSINADDGCVDGIFYGHMQQTAGTYSLTLTENRGGKEMATVDRTAAWQLVARQDNACEGTDEGALGVSVEQMASEISLSGGGRKTDEVKKKKRFRMVIGRSVNPNSLQDTGTVNTYCYGLCRSKCGRKNDYKYRIPFYQRDYITKVVVYVKQPGSDLYVCNQERNISCYDRTALFEFGLGTQGFNGAVIGVRLDKYVETNGTAEFYVSTKTMPLCIPNVGKRHYFHNGHRRKRSLSDARDVVACNVCSWGKWEKKGEDKLVLTRDVNQNEDFVFTGIVKKLCNVPVRKDGYTFYFHEKYVTVSNVRKIPGCPKNSLRGKYRLYQLRNGEFSRRVDSFISFRVVCRWTYETTYRITIEDIKKERV